MALSNITFIKGQGGLGRPLPGQDYISGLLTYSNVLPSGFTTVNRIKALYALSDAVNAGILNDYSDATAATFSYLVTAVGAAGDKIDILSTEPNSTVDLGTYVRLSTDTTIAILGASIAAFINSGTINHGYSAAFATATVTVTMPKKLGIFPNNATTPIAVVITGAIAGTLTQPAGGVASALAVYYYHISEFFRIQPKGVLYFGFFAVPSSYSFVEVSTMQNFANGIIRQIGVFKNAIYAVADLTALDIICKVNDVAHKPISSLYAADLSATTDISTLVDLNTLTANKATAVIGQDGGGQGNFLFLTTGKSVTILGALLGAVALAKVSENVGWAAKFNISNGTECELLSFANGQLFSSVAITDGLIDSLNTRRYVFLRKFVGISGSWFNDSHTATTVASDYAYIENNRTIDKATRGVYTFMLPSLNGPLTLNADGTLAETTTAYLSAQAELPLNQMVRDGEMSAFAVLINPLQNVLSTSTIIIAVTLVINGVARQIIIPIGFKPKI